MDEIETRLRSIEMEARKYSGDAEREIGWFFWIAGILIFIVPALSVMVTILTQMPQASGWAFVISSTVSVLSVFNAAYKPTARYSLGSTYANRFWVFLFILRTEYDSLKSKHQQSADWVQVANDFLTTKAKELALLVESYNNEFFAQFAPVK